MKSSLLVFGCSLLIACGDHDQHDPSATDGATANSATVPNGTTRTPDDWHSTDTLFQVMGGVRGKTVADLFVGDGYYTMKLLEAGARVIASDDDPRNVEALRARAKELGIGEDRLIIRAATAGVPNLAAAEVDLALCTKSYLSIPDKTGFFTKVKASIKPPSQLFIVDFLPMQTPVGTPMDQRVTEERVMDDMEPCGFTDIGGYTKILPYRYVVQAMDFVEIPDEATAPAQ